MKLVVLGLNHRSAAVEVRERFSFDKDEVVSALNRLYEFDCVAECVILSTCNRTEIYAALEGVEFPKEYMLAVLKDLKGADHIDEDAFFFYEERFLCRIEPLKRQKYWLIALMVRLLSLITL